jgi:hypothetical protein
MDYRETVRRILATLAFRTRHAFHEAPVGFDEFDPGLGVRTPLQILNHMNDCIAMTYDVLGGRKPERLKPVPLMEALETFHLKLSQLDKSLAEGVLPDDEKCLRLLQGPLLDAVTHVGQLMMLRRLMGSPIPGVVYYRSDIRNGQVGPNQPLPTT